MVSDIDKAMPFEWQAIGLREDFDIHFVLLRKGDSALETFLIDHDIPFKRFEAEGKIKLIWQLSKHFRLLKPDLVHCHLRKAEMAGIPASFISGIRNRVYTRHSSTYNHMYHKKGVLVDRITNKLSTKIVSISENVSEVLRRMESVPKSKIELIRHGFDLNRFKNVDSLRIDKIHEKYNIEKDVTIVGVVARFTRWKGFDYIIPAFKLFHDKHPNTLFIFANAKGNDEVHISNLLSTLPSQNIRLIEYEDDNAALYNAMDIYVHTPIDESVEAFGQTYIEALAAGVPSVFTLSGIAREFITDGKNALVVPFKDSESINQAMERLYNDKKMREQLRSSGYDSLKEFELNPYISHLKKFYFNEIDG